MESRHRASKTQNKRITFNRKMTASQENKFQLFAKHRRNGERERKAWKVSTGL